VRSLHCVIIPLETKIAHYLHNDTSWRFPGDEHVIFNRAAKRVFPTIYDDMCGILSRYAPIVKYEKNQKVPIPTIKCRYLRLGVSVSDGFLNFFMARTYTLYTTYEQRRLKIPLLYLDVPSRRANRIHYTHNTLFVYTARGTQVSVLPS